MIIAAEQDEKEYFVILNTRDKNLVSTFLTKKEIIKDVYDLCDLKYVYECDRDGNLHQILDLVELDENNRPVSLASLVEVTDTDHEFEIEVDKLLEIAQGR